MMSRRDSIRGEGGKAETPDNVRKSRRQSGSPGEAVGGRPGRRRWGYLLLVGGVVAMAAGLWIGLIVLKGPHAGDAAGRNVLLITLDTTRADCLACYGHPFISTPNIDSLAEDGVLFNDCVSCVPLTLPSHASILTGTYPYVHRARLNGAYLTDSGNETLPEVLRAAGYATGAEVGAYVLDRIWGIDQGFDTYQSETTKEQRGERFERLANLESEQADAVCSRAIKWLSKHGSQKYFLWVHFFDPHQPYDPPARFRRKYKDPYLGEIAFVDEQIGRLLRYLHESQLAESTVVVLTADHGESLGEHGETTHGYYIYESTMHVPLIIRWPGGLPAGRKIGQQVRTIDIAPTILSLLGEGIPADTQGRSLLPLIAGNDLRDEGAYGESTLANDAFGYARLRSYRADGWKYVRAPTPELYDLATDPKEEHNVSGEHPDRVKAMSAALEKLIRDSMKLVTSTERVSAMDSTAAERLAALGYVGGYMPSESERNELELLQGFDGPDPKDRLKEYNRFQQARSAMGAERWDVAEPILKEVIAQSPDVPAFHDQYATLLRRQHRFKEAVAQYEALLKLRPRDAVAHYRLGKVLGELGRTDEAVANLKKAVEAMPVYLGAHSYLGLALAKAGKPAEAEQHFRVALSLDPSHEESRAGLSSALYAQKRYAEAMNVLREGLEQSPDNLMLANNLAWQLATVPEAELRDGQEAVRLAENCVKQAGEDEPMALDTLAAAYAEAGRFNEAVATAKQAIQLAQSKGQTDAVKQITEHLEVYAKGQAYRESQ